jgi:hypothetical protein
MTNKEFVLSIYPDAKSKKFYCNGVRMTNIIIGKWLIWDSTAKSATGSWKMAADDLRKTMLRKLES